MFSRQFISLFGGSIGAGRTFVHLALFAAKERPP
jgi:hypothetical protein